jgi:phytoene synthase
MDNHQDLRQCEAILRQGSKSFHAASRLFPERLRQALAPVYAFCREADDAVDEAPATAATLTALDRRLHQVYVGTATNPVDRAFGEVVQRYDIPRAVPQALLDGFAWEVEGRSYDSLGDVEAYATRVAGTVGVMVALVLGRRDAEALARACDLGVAMQLTNISRDVGEDARMGRLYLPRDWMREEGIDPDVWLADPRFEPGIGRVVARLLRRARVLYQRADAGVARLPREARIGVRAARLIYAAIGDRIAEAGFDSVNQRAYTPWPWKLTLAMRAVPSRWWRVSQPEQHGRCTAAASQFLVAAVAGNGAALPTAPTVYLPARTSRQERIEASLRLAVGGLTGEGCPPKLARAIHDAVFPAGHRLRPLLCYAVAEAVGEDEPQLTDAAAVGLELIHSASLIQDDLPAFDDADERRNRPSIHAQHGEALAILASDALIFGGFQAIGSLAGRHAMRAGRMSTLLAMAGGAPSGLVAGQGWESEPEVELERYHTAKTAALFEAAAMLGAVANGHDPARWRAVGHHLGLAYQTADDLQDAAGPEREDAILGRPNVAHQQGRRQSLARLRRHGRLALRAVPQCSGRVQLRHKIRGLLTMFEGAAGVTPARPAGRVLASATAD